jgi:hypothetical protein
MCRILSQIQFRESFLFPCSVELFTENCKLVYYTSTKGRWNSMEYTFFCILIRHSLPFLYSLRTSFSSLL